MQILITHNDNNKRYAYYCAQTLENLGFSVGCYTPIEATQLYDITIDTTPTFFIIKNDIPGYYMQGIQNIDTVIKWAENSNIKQE